MTEQQQYLACVLGEDIIGLKKPQVFKRMILMQSKLSRNIGGPHDDLFVNVINEIDHAMFMLEEFYTFNEEKWLALNAEYILAKKGQCV